MNTNGIVVVAFSVVDKANQVKFFEMTFLVANICLKIVFKMLFLTLSGANVDFSVQKLYWKTYITDKTFPTTRPVKLVGIEEFAAAALNLKHETYKVYVAFLSSILLIPFLNSTPLDVHPSRRLQISGLNAKKTPTKVLNKYADFVDILSPDLTFKLLKHIGINDHIIKLITALWTYLQFWAGRIRDSKGLHWDWSSQRFNQII